ncbi:MAG TPA: hypothetical protein VGN20_28415 [Mucilaginibacter sp.]|jgi:hypothetical protein
METIKIMDKKALKLVNQLEDLNLIQIVRYTEKTTVKISTLLIGSISAKQAEEMHKELKRMRS